MADASSGVHRSAQLAAAMRGVGEGDDLTDVRSLMQPLGASLRNYKLPATADCASIALCLYDALADPR